MMTTEEMVSARWAAEVRERDQKIHQLSTALLELADAAEYVVATDPDIPRWWSPLLRASLKRARKLLGDWRPLP